VKRRTGKSVFRWFRRALESRGERAALLGAAGGAAARLRARSWGGAYGYAEGFPYVLRYAVVLSFISFGAGYGWYFSLPRTVLAANNTIYQAQCALLYAIGLAMRTEALSLTKVLAVALSIGGVALLALTPAAETSELSHPSTAGYVALLASVLLHCAFQIIYHGFDAHLCGGGGGAAAAAAAVAPPAPAPAPTDVHANVTAEPAAAAAAAARDAAAEHAQSLLSVELSLLITAVISVLSFIVLPVLIAALVAADVEPLLWPGPEDLGLLALNAVLDMLYMVCLLVSVVVTSPLYSALGQMFVVPCSIILDYFVNGSEMGANAFVGAALVLVGFALVSFPVDRGQRWLLVACARCRHHRGTGSHRALAAHSSAAGSA
jgi:drug/metabolite transporter (DMT)-like permease